MRACAGWSESYLDANQSYRKCCGLAHLKMKVVYCRKLFSYLRTILCMIYGALSQLHNLTLAVCEHQQNNCCGHSVKLYTITKTCLFKYTDNFTTKKKKNNNNNNNNNNKKSNIFHISAQNIDCGYSFDEVVLTSTHTLCF